MAQPEHEHGLHAVAISDHVETVSRRIARTWSITAVALLVILGLTVGIPHGPDLEAWERTVQLGTLALLAVGVMISWKSEGLGGSIMVVGSTLLWGMAALQHQPASAFLPTLLFLVPAVAFLVAWKRTRTRAALVVLITAVSMVLVVGGAVATVIYDRGYGAAHPESSLAPLPDTPIVWIWSGAVTGDSASVVARVDDADTVELILAAPDGVERTLPATAVVGNVWRFELAELAAETSYTYVPVVDGSAVTARSGCFATFGPSPTSFTVAAASCARLGSNGAVYDTINALEPDLFISTGDLFYADYVETAEHYAHAYASSLGQPAQAALYSAVPIAYVWDDHDYGRNNSDRTMPYRDLALAAYRQNVPHYPLDIDEAICQAFSIGRVQFVLLDERSNRDPGSTPDGPNKSMLGSPQLEWLEARLSDNSFALTVLVSQVPWVADADDGADYWGGYAYERAVIADFIAANDIDNLLMVAGDAHMVAIDDGSNTDYSATGNASFPLLQAAALDRPGSVKGGPYSEGAFPGGGQFGIIEVEDNGGDAIAVRIAGMTWEGEVRVEYSFTVDAP